MTYKSCHHIVTFAICMDGHTCMTMPFPSTATTTICPSPPPTFTMLAVLLPGVPTAPEEIVKEGQRPAAWALLNWCVWPCPHRSFTVPSLTHHRSGTLNEANQEAANEGGGQCLWALSIPVLISPPQALISAEQICSALISSEQDLYHQNGFQLYCN
jgi:hypothetical protein